MYRYLSCQEAAGVELAKSSLIDLMQVPTPEPFKAKLIDFGHACKASNTIVGSNIQLIEI